MRIPLLSEIHGLNIHVARQLLTLTNMSDAYDAAANVTIRLEITERALQVIHELRATYGGLVLHESGLRGSVGSPVCYPESEFDIGSSDVLLGKIAGVPFFMNSAEMLNAGECLLILDVVPGHSNALFLEEGCGLKFVTRLQPVPSC